jgi:hypothetical protein
MHVFFLNKKKEITELKANVRVVGLCQCPTRMTQKTCKKFHQNNFGFGDITYTDKTLKA